MLRMQPASVSNARHILTGRKKRSLREFFPCRVEYAYVRRWHTAVFGQTDKNKEKIGVFVVPILLYRLYCTGERTAAKGDILKGSLLFFYRRVKGLVSSYRRASGLKGNRRGVRGRGLLPWGEVAAKVRTGTGLPLRADMNGR